MRERGLDTDYQANAVEVPGMEQAQVRLLIEEVQRKEERIAMLEAMVKKALPDIMEGAPRGNDFAPASMPLRIDAACLHIPATGAQVYGTSPSITEAPRAGGAMVYDPSPTLAPSWKMDADTLPVVTQKTPQDGSSGGAQVYPLPKIGPETMATHIPPVTRPSAAAPVSTVLMRDAAQAQWQAANVSPVEAFAVRGDELLQGSRKRVYEAHKALRRMLALFLIGFLALLGTLGLLRLHRDKNPSTENVPLTTQMSLQQRTSVAQDGRSNVFAAVPKRASASVSQATLHRRHRFRRLSAFAAAHARNLPKGVLARASFRPAAQGLEVLPDDTVNARTADKHARMSQPLGVPKIHGRGQPAVVPLPPRRRQRLTSPAFSNNHARHRVSGKIDTETELIQPFKPDYGKNADEWMDILPDR